MVAREMISLPSGVSSASELEPLLIIASLSPDGPRTPFSPVHQAIKSGSSISSLLSSSPPFDLNQRDFLGRTPLIHASRINNFPAVQLLLRAGAGAGAKLIDARDSLGQTALLAALVGGHIRIALALLNAGCAVRVANDVGRTPLHAIFRTWDSWNPHPDSAEVLARLVQGGDVCARSSYGYTPLHYLVWRARTPVPLVTSVLRMVLDAGADVDTKDKALGAPAVLYAVRARSSAVLRILLERGARLTFVDQSGANILGELATSADLEGLKIIEDARMSGVNVFLADAKQHTPLGKWRKRVRLRKLEDTTISIREETAAFELLVRDIRDRQLQEDIDHLGEILRGIETTNLSQAHKSLSQLIQKKTEITLIQDIETLRALRIQLKEGMWEAARETVHEIVEICRDRSKRSPWAEDQYHWRELQVSEWVDTAGTGGTT
ncbi:Fibronectin type 3 and ankyrin repeat domains 1 protein [Penicillium canescens]|nr:Fibronectin type 3 and ankyrin repeat domains 1 protein [Penicillium canescens]KAJ6046927.1 Fibronectin type 3 and ankyrin repeat domains 1 protein [Penicillium canescens]KAJ6054017.1 Fibronectin type 3 and ankyrin repeat domains 1 protein [Penicillium canescens]